MDGHHWLCAFGILFWSVKLYADATLQLFFIGTSVVGLVNWQRNRSREERPVSRASTNGLANALGLGLVVTVAYAFLLARLTDAAAPLPDSAVLVFSVVAPLLLVGRRVETWWFWLLVNSIAVPLYVSRELYVTAIMYSGFWMNALVSLRHWQRLATAT